MYYYYGSFLLFHRPNKQKILLYNLNSERKIPVPEKHHLRVGHVLSQVHLLIFPSLFLFFNSPTAYLSTQFLFL